LFYAAGYNVPENYITYFDPKILKVGKEVTFTDENGDDRPMTGRDIQAILNKVEHLPNGMIRALASKYIKGEIIGGFKYEGTRQDDPNDFIPHQHRRELRGLYVMCAWLKHFDTKAGNNLDTYVNENGKQYIKHYLIDFGSTLGSAAHSPQPPYKGHENDLDGHAILENIATAGLYVRPWEKLGPIQYPSIGRIGHELFQPGDTKPNYPNPAFENCTHRDGYWGAKLVMSFTDEQLAAIVKQGQYSNPDAEAYLLQTLKKRRDKTGRYWFTRINPLDHFKIVENKLCFQDLGVEGNLWKKEKSKYAYTVRLNSTKPLFSKISQESHIHLNDLQNSPHSISKDDQIEIEIRVKRLMENKLSKWVRIYLKQSPSGDWECLGIRREE
jgi:hypothetical protein